jgi:inner membrane protein
MDNSESFYDNNRLLIKALLIGFLTLLMLIPASIITNLVQERQTRQAQVVAEVSSKWAASQTVTGPVLIVPYTYTYNGPGPATQTIRKTLHILPESLRITGSVSPEVRKRSIYQVMLYKGDLRLEGTFAPDRHLSLVDSAVVDWSKARLLIGVTDPRGLEEEVMLTWPDGTRKFEAGVPANGAITNGLSVPVAFDPTTGASFSVSLKLRGSTALAFTPVGKSTEVSLKSSWQHPAFDGSFLPDTTAAIGDKGFNAHWKVLSSSRTYPQAWKDNKVDLLSSAFGVRLVQPADGYAKTERSIKYAILFIALTFAIFFFLEIFQKKQVHPLQYLLVGLALCIFYSLLLSISEYTGFNIAYAISSLATVSLIGMYVWSVFHNGITALSFAATLGGLYAYIYSLIQLEDYSLLFGSIGLFLILAILMYFSRKVDWYNIGKRVVPDPQS